MQLNFCSPLRRLRRLWRTHSLFPATMLAVSLVALLSRPVGALPVEPTPVATPAPGVLGAANHSPDGLFHPLPAAQRFLDTRPGTGGTDTGGAPVGIGGWTGRLGVGQTIQVQIAGRLGVPAANIVKAVAMNVTVVDPLGSGYITIWPDLKPKLDSSNLNYAKDITIPNFVIVPVGTNGRVSAFNGANDGVARGHLIFDVVGYYTTAAGPAVGGSFYDFSERFFDSRSPASFVQRGAGAVNFLAPGQWRKVKDNLYDPQFPTYVFNVTVTESSGNGFLTVLPGNRVGAGAPSVSNLNFRSGFDVANMVMVKPDANGEFSIYNGGTGALHVIFDFVGFYDDGTEPIDFGSLITTDTGPFRFSDNRTNLNKGVIATNPDGFTITFDVASDARIPVTAQVLILNVTAIPTTGNGYLTVFQGPERPDTSTLNFRAGQVVPNLTVVLIGEDRKIRVFVSKGVSLGLLIDVMGWTE